jgi:hypothetical protein
MARIAALFSSVAVAEGVLVEVMIRPPLETVCVEAMGVEPYISSIAPTGSTPQ